VYVLLQPACCCSYCVAVSFSSVAVPSPRDRRSLHMAARPSLRCRVPMPSISPSVDWDVSSVTDMSYMFAVRVPPPRV
jgi:hypothetical protein